MVSFYFLALKKVVFYIILFPSKIILVVQLQNIFPSLLCEQVATSSSVFMM